MWWHPGRIFCFASKAPCRVTMLGPLEGSGYSILKGLTAPQGLLLETSRRLNLHAASCRCGAQGLDALQQRRAMTLEGLHINLVRHGASGPSSNVFFRMVNHEPPE